MIAAVAAALVASSSDRFSSAPLAGPLDYANADGALYVQAAIAGWMLALLSRHVVTRIAWGAVAAGFTALPFIIHVAAAAWLAIVMPAIAVLPGLIARGKAPRWSVAGLGGLFLAALVATSFLGASLAPGGRDPVHRLAGDALTGERLVLWHEAYLIMRAHPVTGVGPGRYRVVSPSARRDPDHRWAHHEFLQQGAEGGVVGLLLLAVLFLWALGRLWSARPANAITALSAAAVAALGIHATVDYVMHFPAIPIVGAALAGVGMATRDPQGGSNDVRDLRTP